MSQSPSALERARAFERAHAADVPDGQRPLTHFTPLIGWMNDPNGFCWHQGRCHLFYQYYPYDTVWGTMHWGHASSEDLLRWRHEPCALAPDSPADAAGCFSGSAISLPDGRLMLVYTGVQGETGGQYPQAQCIAIGDGTDFIKHPENPVIPVASSSEEYSRTDFRDPKAWRAADGSFDLVVGCRHASRSGAVLRFTSQDGRHWQSAGEIDSSRDQLGQMWECPDFFTLDGCHVLLVSPQEMAADGEFAGGYGTAALIGSYDAEAQRFTRHAVQPIDLGQEFYAPQTALLPDGRRVMIAWLDNWATCKSAPRRHPWYGEMTLPRELSLREGRLWQWPVRELESLWRGKVDYRGMRVCGERRLPGVLGRPIDLDVALRTGDGAGRLEIRLSADGAHPVTLVMDAERGEVVLDRTHATDLPEAAPRQLRAAAAPRDGRLRVRAVVDRESVELFINGGERALTARLLPDDNPVIAFIADPSVTLDVNAHPLGK